MNTESSWWSRLNTQEKEDLCTQWLPWAADWLRRRYGEDGEELAGEALFDALSAYDGEHSLKSWLTHQLHWAWCRAMRIRYGGPAHTRDSRPTVFFGLGRLADHHDPFDDDAGDPVSGDTGFRIQRDAGREGDPADQCMRAETTGRILKNIQFLPAPARHVVLCRFLGSLTIEDISHITGTRPRQLRQTLAEVRQLIPLD